MRSVGFLDAPAFDPWLTRLASPFASAKICLLLVGE
jgi:hypothetical protein